MDDAGHRRVEVAPPGSGVPLIRANGSGHGTPERIGSYVGLILSVDDMASTHASLKAQGVTFVSESEGSPWGVFAELRDPDGNAFVLHRAPGRDGGKPPAARRGRKQCSVNEPGGV